MSGAGTYKIRMIEGGLGDLVQECNRIFGLLSDRLDKMEGYRGSPVLHSSMETGYDLIITDKDKGVVLKDDGNPANYWRVTIDSVGDLQTTSLGRNY
jgi:hypothetical protein